MRARAAAIACVEGASGPEGAGSRGTAWEVGDMAASRLGPMWLNRVQTLAVPVLAIFTIRSSEIFLLPPQLSLPFTPPCDITTGFVVIFTVSNTALLDM